MNTNQMRTAQAVCSKLAIERELTTITCVWQRLEENGRVGEAL